MLAFSCADEPLPFDTFDQYEKGGFARQLSNDGGEYLFTDPDNSAFTFEVEYYSENNGGDVKAHEWFVYHRNNVTGDVSDPVLMESVSSGSFGTNANSGLPSHTFTFTMNDALAAMGKTIDDVNGGDDLIFDGEIVMNDDRRFGPDNSGASVQGGAGFDGVFRIIKPLLCPSNLGGTYTSTTTGTSTDGCCPDETTVESEVTLTETATGSYTINDWSADLYRVWYGPDGGDYGIDQAYIDAGNMEATLIDACEIISSSLTEEPFGESLEITGMVVDPDAGIIEYSWSNGWGDQGTVKLTRKE